MSELNVITTTDVNWSEHPAGKAQGKYSGARIYQALITLSLMLFVGCGVRPMTLAERSLVEKTMSEQGESLVKASHLPHKAPLREVELVRSFLKAHTLTARYLPFFITSGDLISQSVRRLEQGRVGDLVVFRYVPRSLPLAVVTKVMSPTHYQAVGILRGEIRYLEIDLSSPDKRRRGGTIINTVIRTIHPDDSPPYLYLAGELFSEFRSIF